MQLFPTAPLTAFLRGYFKYMSLPISEDEQDAGPEPAPDPDDPFDIMLVCLYSLPLGLLAMNFVLAWLRTLSLASSIR